MRSIALFVLVISMSSCYKDYTCQCTSASISQGYAGFTSSTAGMFRFDARTKKKAKTICSDHEADILLTDATTSCILQ